MGDDDTKAILSEIREILRRNEARDTEWMRTSREMSEKNHRLAKKSAVVQWTMIGVALVMLAVVIAVALRARGMV